MVEASLVEIRQNHRRKSTDTLTVSEMSRARLRTNADEGGETRGSESEISRRSTVEVREASKVPRIALTGNFNSSKAAGTTPEKARFIRAVCNPPPGNRQAGPSVI